MTDFVDKLTEEVNVLAGDGNHKGDVFADAAPKPKDVNDGVVETALLRKKEIWVEKITSMSTSGQAPSSRVDCGKYRDHIDCDKCRDHVDCGKCRNVTRRDVAGASNIAKFLPGLLNSGMGLQDMRS